MLDTGPNLIKAAETEGKKDFQPLFYLRRFTNYLLLSMKETGVCVCVSFSHRVRKV